MKKILLVLITTILITGCSSKLITLNEGISKDTPITFGSIPSTEELVTADEETVITEELAGDKYIITATKGEKVETQEFAVDFETIDVDGTLPVDMNQFYSNLAKLTKVSYVFNEDETVMTVTDENGEEPHSFDVPINIIYPEYTIAEDVTIDTYVGYDINEFVTVEDGVEITSELNEENSLLNITLSKNDWTKTESVSVILTSSEPQYPVKYWFVKQIDTTGFVNTKDSGIGYIIFDSSTSGRMWNIWGSEDYFTMDENYIYLDGFILTYGFEEDGFWYQYTGGASKFGKYYYELSK